MTAIQSPHNSRLKEVRALRRASARAAGGRFVAEGEDLLDAARAAGWAPLERLVAAGSGLEGTEVEPGLLAGVSSLGSGTRALAVYEQRWAPPAGPLCVALWGVGDPGNVGAVLRSALAFGAGSVALGPGCADPFGPKAVRASMGAIFAIPVARVALDAPGHERTSKAPAVGTQVLEGPTVEACAFKGPTVEAHALQSLPGDRVALAAREGAPLAGPLTGEVTLLIGAERDGLPADVLAAADRVAHIPIRSESLNAAMAATLALYEVTRGAAGEGAAPPARRMADR